MLDRFCGRRWAWSAVALAAVLILGGVTYGFGVTKSTQLLLWTEQTATGGAAPTVLAPDWVKIGRDLKPAVVNVSAKRAQGPAPEMSTPRPHRIIGRLASLISSATRLICPALPL